MIKFIGLSLSLFTIRKMVFKASFEIFGNIQNLSNRPLNNGRNMGKMKCICEIKSLIWAITWY